MSGREVQYFLKTFDKNFNFLKYLILFKKTKKIYINCIINIPLF